MRLSKPHCGENGRRHSISASAAPEQEADRAKPQEISRDFDRPYPGVVGPEIREELRRIERGISASKPQPGRVAFNGQNIGGLPPYRISRLGIGFVPQERGVFGSLTVRENLTVAARGGRSGGWTLERIYSIFPRLRERADFRGSKLSGGEQQMLSIARALLLNPELLVLDEPSEGLAPLIVQEILSILRDVRDSGLSILLVEQNVRAALEVADRHYVMSKGAVCYTCTTEDIRKNAALLNPYLGL